MARTATSGGTSKAKATSKPRKPAAKPTRAVATRSSSRSEDAGNAATDAFLKLLQSPIVADLMAVAATAALAALAEHGFSSRGAGDKRRAGRAVKEAGKAAAAAIGRRLATEVDEIRKASKAKGGEAK